MADKKYFEWLGDDDVAKLPFINRELAGIRFNGPSHIGVTGDSDKIKFFSESKNFKEVTKTAYEVAAGQSVDDAIESAEVGTTGLSAGSGTQGIGGNGSSTPG